MALTAGSIAFTGFNADGNDNLAFVALEPIAAGTVITFTDNAWNGSAFGTNESTWTWTAGSDIAAGTVVTMDNLAAGQTATSNNGTITYLTEGTRGLDTGAEVVYAYIGTAAAPTFLTAIGNGAINNTAQGLLTNTGLAISSTAVVGTAISFTTNANHDIVAYNGPRATGQSLENLRAQVFDRASWVTQNTNNDDSSDGVGPDAPFNATLFTVDANAQKVSFAADSLTVTKSEGDSGTTSFTFVVERTTGTTGDTTFTGTFNRGDLSPADFPGNTLPSSTFSGTIPAGQASTTVTVTVVGDLAYDPLAEERFSLVLKTATNSAATAYVNQGATDNTATGVVVSDDTQQVVGFAAGSVEILVTEGNDGTRTVTFIVERTGDGGTAGDVAFSGSFNSALLDAADFGGTLPPATFSGVILDGQTSATVSFTISGDQLAEGTEYIQLALSAATNPAADSVALGNRNARAYMLNDDGPSTVLAGQMVSEVGMSGQSSLRIEQGGEVVNISVAGQNFDVTINSAGRFGFNGTGLTTPVGNGKITFNNEATGAVSGIILPNYSTANSLEFVLDNSGQVGGFSAAQSPNYSSIAIDNRAGGVIGATTTRSGIEVIGNTTINNAGTIITYAGNREGIVYNGPNVVVNNLAGGRIEGTHHAVTGIHTVTITNEAGGTLIGRNGSAVNIDNTFNGGQVVTVLNRGLMQGQASSTFDGDGDAIDTDATAIIENWGTIEGLGHAGSHNGGLNVSEGIAIGGGRITNHAGGLIAGYGRGIQVDDSSEGGAFTAVTITNAGTIRGYGNLPKTYPLGAGSQPVIQEAYAPLMNGGEAINIIGTWADTLSNSATGQIIGGVRMGGGNDTLDNDGTMTATGGSAVDLGEGDDLFVNRGTINGAVLLGAGADELINVSTGVINGDVSFGDGNDRLGNSGLIVGTIDTGTGDDFVNLYTGTTVQGTILLGTGNDLVLSTADSGLVIDAGDGDDQMYVAGYIGGNDTLSGGAGNDAIYAGLGDDLIDGGADNDTLSGEGGNDVVDGGAGDDHIIGGDGADMLRGGEGDDRIEAGTGDIIDGGDGIDTVELSGSGGTLGRVSNAEKLVVQSGTWGVVDAADFAEATVNSGASLITYGNATDTTVAQGGTHYVWGGATGSEVSGQQILGPGAVASATLIASGGEQTVHTGSVSNSATIIGDQTVWGSAGQATIGNGGLQTVFGTVTGTLVESGGEQSVHVNGIATGSTLNAGGVQIAWGSAVDTTVNGGNQYVWGTASGTTILSGAQHVGSGGSASDTTIDSGGLSYVHSGGTLHDVTFAGAGGTLVLDEADAFSGEISGWEDGDRIALGDIDFGASTTLAYVANAGNTGGTLTVSDGTQVATLELLGQYTAADFAMSSDGYGGTIISDPGVAQQNVLAPALAA